MVFDRADVVAASRQHLGTDVFLAEQGIAGDYLAVEGQDTQQFQGRRVLVGLGVHAELAEDGRYPGGVGGEQVDAGHAPAGRAP
jgi:hypothetical protein